MIQVSSRNYSGVIMWIQQSIRENRWINIDVLRKKNRSCFALRFLSLLFVESSSLGLKTVKWHVSRPYLGVTNLTRGNEQLWLLWPFMTLFEIRWNKAKTHLTCAKSPSPLAQCIKEDNTQKNTPLVSVLYQCKSHSATINACIVTNTSKRETI